MCGLHRLPRSIAIAFVVFWFGFVGSARAQDVWQPRTWTNSQGKQLTGRLISISEEAAVIECQGRSYTILIADFAPQDQGLLRIELAKQSGKSSPVANSGKTPPTSAFTPPKFPLSSSAPTTSSTNGMQRQSTAYQMGKIFGAGFVIVCAVVGFWMWLQRE